MIGGGSWSANYDPDFKCDEELFVRMAQTSALFPMMQFSWAPFRMLSAENAELCLASAELHRAFAPYITRLVEESAVSGEPIVRHMEYEFPHCGYERIVDQFMLGSDILVCPVIEKGQREKKVALPSGKWLYLGKTEYEGGGEITVPAPLDTLVYFVKKEN
jgi:alpha-glucosidase (family GH31 glycosyl hydrolase)